MKRQKLIFQLTLTFLIVLLSNCAQPTEGLTTPSTVISTLPISTATPLPSFLPSPTDTLTSTVPPTMIPTLPTEQAGSHLLDLLTNNGKCRLPCLWGITPGTSSLQDALGILMPLGILAQTKYLDVPGVGSIAPRYKDKDLEIYTSLDFLTTPQDGIVNRIAFNAEAHRPLEQGGYEDVFDWKFFGEKVSAYTLPHVLSEQGVPSNVMIATFGGLLTRGGTGGFDILLLYPDQGILVNYTTQMHLVASNVRGCPENAHVEMDLHPPGQSESFYEALKPTDWAIKMKGYKPLEEVTSMSVEEFYDTFHASTAKCIETPANLWPIPEP